MPEESRDGDDEGDGGLGLGDGGSAVIETHVLGQPSSRGGIP
jgi:hypothetical protein